MRPHKLRMFNIGPFTGQTEIDFNRMDDIFLISGKTGSGKTTIFDAICFALYGKLPGSRKNLEPRIRSDFAGLEEDCWVELEFSLGAMTYLIQRSPKMERPKKRGNGTTTIEETAVLYQLTESGERRSLSSRKGEADEKITGLLGLSAEEFVKIVLLPQGEFAQFLQQNSQARREVLRKLFPVDEAVAIRELAADKKKEAEAQVRMAEQTLREASNRYHEAENQAEQERLRQELAEFAEQESRLVQNIKTLSEALSQARQESELRARLGSIHLEKQHLDEQKEQINQISLALSRNQRANPARTLLFQADQLKIQWKLLADELEQAKTRMAAAIHQYEELETRAEEMRILAGEAEGLREQKGALSQAVEEEQRLLKLESTKDALLGTIAEGNKRLSELKSEIENLTAQIKASEATAKQEGLLQEQKETSLSIMEQLRNLLRIAQDWEQKQPRWEAGQSSLARGEAELNRIEKRLPELAEELATLEETKKNRELEVLSAQLSATLREGLPCPVCGSIHHPEPAAAPPPVFGLEEKLGSLQKEQRELEQGGTVLRTELRTLRSSQESLDRELQALLERYREARKYLYDLMNRNLDQPFTVTSIDQETIPSVPAVQEDIRKNSGLAESIGRALQQAGKESRNLTQWNRTLQEKQQELASLEAKQEGNGKREEELSIQIDEMRARLQIFLDLWKTETISLALNRLQSKLETMESAVSAYKNKQQSIFIEKAQAEQGLKELEERYKNLTEAVHQNQLALEAMARDLSFEGPEDLMGALLAPEREQEFKKAEADWKEDYSRLQHQEEETLRSLGNLKALREQSGIGEDAADLEATLTETETERQKLAAEGQALRERLHSLELDRRRYQEALDQFNNLHQNLVRWRALADDLSGINPKKWPFDSWLLGLYLQEVTGYANHRLSRMSEGRYSIILNPEGEGGRALAGLDLAVFDSFTGKTRPCATLSGGESFMASISLALGLADSIQSRSGAVRLDAIFIDEGFGSLDEASLDRALSILDEIRDHRMVGLISHVGEMKSRIPSKIEVIKTNGGSKIVISNSV